MFFSYFCPDNLTYPKNLIVVKVVIPIYKSILSPYENISLRQAFAVLHKHPLVFVKPKSLCVDTLLVDFPGAQCESFDDSFFKDISGYNRLMLCPEFYERFVDVSYILIYQLDAYVFRDELKDWCNKGYDYIGAPWLVRPVYRFPLFRFVSWVKKYYCKVFSIPNSQITHFKVGNGGFSLRKVESHLRAIKQLKGVIDTYLSYKKNHVFHEDVFFSVEVNQHGMDFLYPNYKEALMFSFDKYPALCYNLNGEQLPFGCHSWYKRKMKKFWFPIILPQHHHLI